MTDRLMSHISDLWSRFTWCRKSGHLYTAFGSERDDYCANCNKKRKSSVSVPS